MGGRASGGFRHLILDHTSGKQISLDTAFQCTYLKILNSIISSAKYCISNYILVIVIVILI